MADLIEWQPHLNLGIASLDYQHRELAGMLSQFLDTLDNPSAAPQEAVVMLQRIYRHARSHFLYEEKLMLAIGFNESVHHQREHIMLLGELKSLTNDIAAGRLRANTELLHSLRDWFIAHIVTSDREFATCYRRAQPNAAAETPPDR